MGGIYGCGCKEAIFPHITYPLLLYLFFCSLKKKWFSFLFRFFLVNNCSLSVNTTTGVPRKPAAHNVL